MHAQRAKCLKSKSIKQLDQQFCVMCKANPLWQHTQHLPTLSWVTCEGIRFALYTYVESSDSMSQRWGPHLHSRPKSSGLSTYFHCLEPPPSTRHLEAKIFAPDSSSCYNWHTSISFREVDHMISHLLESYVDPNYCWHNPLYLSCSAGRPFFHNVVALAESYYNLETLFSFEALVHLCPAHSLSWFNLLPSSVDSRSHTTCVSMVKLSS